MTLLAHDILVEIKRAQERRAKMLGCLNELWNLATASGNEAMRSATIELKAEFICQGAELLKATSYFAAAKMVGQVATCTVAATDLELHPGSSAQHELTLASLHRAGDHTLDEEGEG